MSARLKNYVQEHFRRKLQRIQCSEIREALNDHFGQEINDNEMGTVVREAFPGVIRKRSNSAHYYENISLKVSKLDEEVQVDEHVQVNGEHAKIGLKDEGTHVDLTGGLYDADISSVPKCMIISRNQLVSDDPKTVLGKGAYGEVSFQTYQGMAIAVKKYKNCSKEDVVPELLTVLNIRPCMFLPIVYGVSTERKPFLMISKFYGSLSTKRSTTLQYYLKKYSHSSAKNGNNSSCSFPAASTSNIRKNDRELLQVAENICEGLDHIHKCGYLHGDIKSNNILIIKQDSNVQGRRRGGCGGASTPLALSKGGQGGGQTCPFNVNIIVAKVEFAISSRGKICANVAAGDKSRVRVRFGVIVFLKFQSFFFFSSLIFWG